MSTGMRTRDVEAESVRAASQRQIILIADADIVPCRVLTPQIRLNFITCPLFRFPIIVFGAVAMQASGWW